MPTKTAPPKLSDEQADEAVTDDDLQLLTVADVAERLRVKPTTVYDLCNAGTLPSVYLGPQTRRIKASDLRDYIDSLPSVRPAAANA